MGSTRFRVVTIEVERVALKVDLGCGRGTLRQLQEASYRVTRWWTRG